MKAPIEMPSAGFVMQQFEIQRIDYGAPEAGGRLNGVQAGFPLWSGIWTVGNTGRDRTDELRAFMAQIRGATRRFLARDLLRPYPKAHLDGFAGMMKAGGGAFTGAATGWSENIASDGDCEITLENLPEDFTLDLGDYIGFSWVAEESSVAGLTWHALVRVVVGGTTADTTGNVTVTVEPPIPAAVPSDAVAYLNEPACVMALVGDQSALNAVGLLSILRGGQITGIQDIRA